MSSKPRLTFVISHIDRWAQFEWIAEEFVRRDQPTQYIVLNPKPGYFEDFLQRQNLPLKSIEYHGKHDLPRAIFQIRSALRSWGTQIVHCHFLDASLAGLTAARLGGVPHRIHTRHHANYHHLYAPKGVLLDRYNNALSTHIVAITQGVKNLLVQKEGVPSDKVTVVHHGFRLNEFIERREQAIQDIRQKYKLEPSAPVIGVVSRFIHWKGVQHILPAFDVVLKKYPSAVLCLANARGPYKGEILKMLSHVSPDNYRLIEFEKDMFSLFHCFDVFAHCPIDNEVEAFGQVYIEAAAAGLPCVFTRSGIANDFFVNEEDCLIVKHQEPQEIAQAFLKLLSNKEYSSQMGQRARDRVMKIFRIENMISEFEKIYAL